MKMKRYNVRILKLFPAAAVILVLFAVAYGCSRNSSKNISFETIESGFKNIPDTVKTSVYWYWLSDNISQEGVIKDLQAMKKAGINRAFIGNIGLNNIPYGKVKIFSDEWWKVLHSALKTATELDIEIGIFNSPGWSQSGGPWIKPAQSMRYLNSSELQIKGPQQLSMILTSPSEDFQRVKVIAFRTPGEKTETLKSFNPIIKSDPSVPGIKKLFDGDTSTYIDLQKNKSLSVDIEMQAPKTVRSLVISTARKKIIAKCELLVKEGAGYSKIKDFDINRSNPSLTVGFDPWAPIVIAIPETTSKNFRIVLKDANPAGAIAEIDLSSLALIERFPEKSLAKMFQTPLPY
jgi:hypothetical protein